MSFVDALLIAFVFITTIVGFFKGTLKISIALVTFYLAVILASLYFSFMARALATNSTSSLQILNMLSFLVILVIAYIILLLTGLYAFRYIHVGQRAQILDKIGGAILGLFLGAMFASIFAMILRYLFITQFVEATLDYPLMRGLAGSTRKSVLLSLFVDGILPVLYAPLSPFLPEQADRIFRSLQ